MQASIYITVDRKSLREDKKTYGYVLECMINGEPVTRHACREIVATYNKAVLTAVCEALGRFTKPCEITIYADSPYLAGNLENNMDKWVSEGFLTAKGSLIANAAEWQFIAKRRNKNGISVVAGTHSYTNWLLEEMKRGDGDERACGSNSGRCDNERDEKKEQEDEVCSNKESD